MSSSDREGPNASEAAPPHGGDVAAPSPDRAPPGLRALAPLRGPDEAVLHVGVDENGLGPLLGPLVVTGVAFRVRGERPRSLGALVGDSKALVAHGDVSLGEAWARALLGALGPEPTTPAEVVARLSIDDELARLAPCPARERPRDASHPSAMCWPVEPEAFQADEALVERCRAFVRGWGSTGRVAGRVGGRFARKAAIELVGVRAALICAHRLNQADDEGRNKLLVDLRQMERVALDLHASGTRDGEPIDAVCGKVGGMNFYPQYFEALSGRLCAVEAEGRAISAYRFPGLGRFSWVRDADGNDPLVGLASLVGKYLRELAMERIVRFLRAAHPGSDAGLELPAASGYRDPTTRRLVSASTLARQARGVPDRCFLRNK